MWQQQLDEIKQGNSKTLARCISYIENEVTGYEELLQQLPASHTLLLVLPARRVQEKVRWWMH